MSETVISEPSACTGHAKCWVHRHTLHVGPRIGDLCLTRHDTGFQSVRQKWKTRASERSATNPLRESACTRTRTVCCLCLVVSCSRNPLRVDTRPAPRRRAGSTAAAQNLNHQEEKRGAATPPTRTSSPAPGCRASSPASPSGQFVDTATSDRSGYGRRDRPRLAGNWARGGGAIRSRSDRC